MGCELCNVNCTISFSIKNRNMGGKGGVDAEKVGMTLFNGQS